jgi:hypothetical protein
MSALILLLIMLKLSGKLCKGGAAQLSKQWQDFSVLIALIAFYFYVVIHHWRGLRLPLPHGRKVRLLFTLLVWAIGVPAVVFSLGDIQTEFLRVLTAPFSN